MRNRNNICYNLSIWYRCQLFIHYRIYDKSLMDMIIEKIHIDSDIIIGDDPLITPYPNKQIKALMMSGSQEKFVIGGTCILLDDLLYMINKMPHDKCLGYYPEKIANTSKEIDFAVEWSNILLIISDSPGVLLKSFDEDMDKYFKTVKKIWKEKGI